ncbi:septal ring lytic transglycosylase RlpA family protein [Derxia gummosa]|uniref:Endolytic peptidoglycan transglycosylase RlpA n=1 Tax=Derxia gummosa DSM 723 TaxID=1121388 RepID=A0A8B6X8W0_9BURK|nr:septal ring lytic transglycosylase RlpA family protein [Derxia gummosa]
MPKPPAPPFFTARAVSGIGARASLGTRASASLGIRASAGATRLPALLALAAAIALAGCSTAPKSSSGGGWSSGMKRGGGDYRKDGPSDASLAELAALPDPLPAVEPLKTGTMKPYTVMGRDYRPMTTLAPYSEEGVASWYGRQFHGLPTASGETYDMHALTAAHTTLPIPSWARVTNLRNGRSTILRINDRGPFKDDRLLDLSYAAAAKLDVVRTGSAPVRVELLLPAEIARIREERAADPQLAFGGGQRAPLPVASRAPAVARDADDGRAATRTARNTDNPGATDDGRITRIAATPAVPVAASARGGPDGDVPSVAPAVGQPMGGDEIAVIALPAVVPAPAPAEGTTRADFPRDPAASTWLQLGAFSSRENAEAARSRALPRLGALGERTRVVQLGRLYRVHVGPFASKEDAGAAREQLASMLGERPVIVDLP